MFGRFFRQPSAAEAKKAAGSMLYDEYAMERQFLALSRLPDPDLVLKKLGLGRAALKRMETDDEISGALETRVEAVLGTPWRLEPSTGAAAEFIEGQLAPRMEELIRGAWRSVPYGYSVLEVVYSNLSPRIGLQAVIEKPMQWFEPRRDGSLLYFPSSGNPEMVDTRYKFLLTRRSPTYENPFGEAMLSRLYWPWFFRVNGWKFWMRYLERFADPLLLAKVGDPESFVEFVKTKLGMDAVIAVNADRNEDLKAVTASGASEFRALEQALQQRIQKVILGQTLTSQVDGQGSYAAAKVHNEVREDKRIADIRIVARTAQRLVNALWELNGFAGDPPEFCMEDESGLELERAERDERLVGAGIVKLTEQYLLDRYDFNEGDFEIPAEKPAGEGAEPPREDAKASARAGLFLASGKRGGFTEDQAAAESLIAEAAALASSPIPADRIRAAIAEASAPEEIAAKLADVYKGSDPAEFREILERALFAADVLGYETAENRRGL